MRIDVYGAKAAQDKNFRFANRPEREYPLVPKTSGVNSIAKKEN